MLGQIDVLLHCRGRGGAVATLIQYPFALPFASRPLLSAMELGGRGEGAGHPLMVAPVTRSGTATSIR